MRRTQNLLTIVSSLLLGTVHLATAASASLDISDPKSIKDASRTIAESIIKRYNDQVSLIPGIFPSETNGNEDWYWYGSGLIWDSLINYWAITGDDQFNSLIEQGLYFQTGDNDDFLPANQTRTAGNDDQATWAFAAMTAAEAGFPEPDNDGISYLQLAQNVFDAQAARWDTDSCGGGLRWQVFPFNLGYDYKNTASNGAFFQLAARLGKFTGNQTYYDWAERALQWSKDSGFVEKNYSSDEPLAVLDGASTDQNCSEINQIQFTASLALYLQGAAYLRNSTGNSVNASSTDNFVDGLLITVDNVFTDNRTGILIESACASTGTCTAGIRAYLGSLSRALATTQYFIPRTSQKISPVLQKSATAAAKACSDGDICDYDWTGSGQSISQFDLGSDLSTLNTLVANLALPQVRTADDDSAPSAPTANSGNSTATTTSGVGTYGSGNGNSPSTAAPSSVAAADGNGAVSLAGPSLMVALSVAIVALVQLV